MNRDDWENLMAILEDAKRARKIASDADASLRHRLRELEEALQYLKPRP